MASRPLCCFVLFCALASLSAAPPARVAFLRPPSWVSDQEAVTYAIQVEPREDNRYLILAASDADGTVRRSDEQLHGVDSPRTRWITWQPLPAGELEVSAILFTADGKQLQVSRPLRVIGRFDEAPEPQESR